MTTAGDLQLFADPIIRVTGLAYVSFQLPDLERGRDFLLDFGLTEVSLKDDVLYMTGGTAPFIYKAVKGPPRFLGIGLTASSTADLARLAAAEGCEVEPLVAPGGGDCIHLVDPDGFSVDVVTGQGHEEQIVQTASEFWNDRERRERVGATKRIAARSAEVVRPGHCVLGVSSFAVSEAWYKKRFGFLTSDAIEAEAGGLMGAFMRCDLGEHPADHHTIFLAETPAKPALRHIAFEVRDFDDLMAGHEHLKARGHKGVWGVGRHLLGSQVFDYWRDPWGHMLEHLTDGDLFTSDDAPNVAPQKDLAFVQWGPAFPAEAMATPTQGSET